MLDEHLNVDPTDSSNVAVFPIAVVTNPSEYSFTLHVRASDNQGHGDDINLEMEIPPSSHVFIENEISVRNVPKLPPASVKLCHCKSHKRPKAKARASAHTPAMS